jgi:ribosomal protein S18
LPTTNHERPTTSGPKANDNLEGESWLKKLQQRHQPPTHRQPSGVHRAPAQEAEADGKVCKFCTEKIEAINYKDVRLLAQFVAESGKIVPRRLTGVCTPHQRRLSSAIKQARNIALLPFAGRAS